MIDRWTDDPQVQDDPALEAFLRDLSAQADGSVDPAVRSATLEAMLATAAETAPRTPGVSWGGRVRRVLGLTGVKLVLAAGVAAATTTGGLAATGSLPAPMQEFAHDLGRQLGIGVPAAPGQLQRTDGDPDTTGRDYAPGQLKKSAGDPDTTGRDHAPGQSGDTGDVPPEHEAPVTSDEASDGADAEQRDAEVRRDDVGEANRVAPDEAPPADKAPKDAGQPAEDADRSTSTSESAEPAPSPEPAAPGGATDQSTPDPAQQPSRPGSAPAGPSQGSGRDAASADSAKPAEPGR